MKWYEPYFDLIEKEKRMFCTKSEITVNDVALLCNSCFFSIWIFFQDHSRITGLQGKQEGISLTPHYHFHLLHRHLDISRAITAESNTYTNSQQLGSNREPLVFEPKTLITKLRTGFKA